MMIDDNMTIGTHSTGTARNSKSTYVKVRTDKLKMKLQQKDKEAET